MAMCNFVIQTIGFILGFIGGVVIFEGTLFIIDRIKERRYEKEQEKRLRDRYFD